MERIKCPFCGYVMPLRYSDKAICKGVFIRCKGKKCKKIFEIKVNKNK